MIEVLSTFERTNFMSDAKQDGQLLSGALKLQESINQRVQEAAQEATKLAKLDVVSKDAVEANRKLLRCQELKRKADDVVTRCVELLPNGTTE
jgi:hypothetical protein